MAGSSWRMLPAAALRGLAKGRRPAFSCDSLRAMKSLLRMTTSPRTSMSRGATPEVLSRLPGTLRTMRMLAVTSSPVSPSPRVEPTARALFS